MRQILTLAMLAVSFTLDAAPLAHVATPYAVAFTLPRTRVQSSNIASIGYDEQAGILEVEFRTGAVYQYYGVPKRVYVGLMNASSHGAYLTQYVKEVGYRYREVR